MVAEAVGKSADQKIASNALSTSSPITREGIRFAAPEKVSPHPRWTKPYHRQKHSHNLVRADKSSTNAQCVQLIINVFVGMTLHPIGLHSFLDSLANDVVEPRPAVLIRMMWSVATAKTHLVCDGVGLSADKIKSSLKLASLQMPSTVVWATKEDQEQPTTRVTRIGKTASRLLAYKFAHISSISSDDSPPIAISSCFLTNGRAIQTPAQLQLIEAAPSVALGNTKELLEVASASRT